MRIIEDLISGIQTEAPVRAIRQGPFQTAVWTRNCGLATTPHESGSHHESTPVRDAGRLAELQSQDLVQMANSESPYEAAIGMATINSLVDIEERLCIEMNAADLLAEKGSDKRIALVGHFPFVQQLRRAAKELWVMEKEPQGDDLPESEAARLIPEADVVGITGSAFINHTVDDLLSLCNSQAYVMVLGGTTPLSSVLFEHRIDAAAGTTVSHPEQVLRQVSEGAVFRQIRGVRRLVLMKQRLP